MRANGACAQRLPMRFGAPAPASRRHRAEPCAHPVRRPTLWGYDRDQPKRPPKQWSYDRGHRAAQGQVWSYDTGHGLRRGFRKAAPPLPKHALSIAQYPSPQSSPPPHPKRARAVDGRTRPTPAPARCGATFRPPGQCTPGARSNAPLRRTVAVAPCACPNRTRPAPQATPAWNGARPAIRHRIAPRRPAALRGAQGAAPR